MLLLLPPPLTRPPCCCCFYTSLFLITYAVPLLLCVCILHSCEIWPASASVFWCSVLAAVVTPVADETQQPPPTVLPFWCFALVVRHASSVMDCILPLMVCPCLAVCAARLGTAVAVYLLPHPPSTDVRGCTGCCSWQLWSSQRRLLHYCLCLTFIVLLLVLSAYTYANECYGLFLFLPTQFNE